jgi:diketogulonate reductase-like aldo/keto reductase
MALIGRVPAGYVDLHIIHSAHGGKEARLKTYQALVNAKAQGIVRDIGVSNLSVFFFTHCKE